MTHRSFDGTCASIPQCERASGAIRRSLVRAQNSLDYLRHDVATLNAKVDAMTMATMQSRRSPGYGHAHRRAWSLLALAHLRRTDLSRASGADDKPKFVPVVLVPNSPTTSDRVMPDRRCAQLSNLNAVAVKRSKVKKQGLLAASRRRTPLGARRVRRPLVLCMKTVRGRNRRSSWTCSSQTARRSIAEAS
jgi:hypothetical protein